MKRKYILTKSEHTRNAGEYAGIVETGDADLKCRDYDSVRLSIVELRFVRKKLREHKAGKINLNIFNIKRYKAVVEMCELYLKR